MFAKGQESLSNLRSVPAMQSLISGSCGPDVAVRRCVPDGFLKVLMIFSAVVMVGNPLQMHRGVLFRDISTLPITHFLETLSCFLHFWGKKTSGFSVKHMELSLIKSFCTPNRKEEMMTSGSMEACGLVCLLILWLTWLLYIMDGVRACVSAQDRSELVLMVSASVAVSTSCSRASSFFHFSVLASLMCLTSSPPTPSPHPPTYPHHLTLALAC